MRRLRVLFVLSLAAALGFAQEQGKHDPEDKAHAEEKANPNEMLWKWANFALLVGGLGYLAAKRGGPFFRIRSEDIRAGIASATEMRVAAEARAAEMEQRLGNLEAQLQELRHSAHQEMTREAERLDAETQQLLVKVQGQAEQEIATAGNVARQQLKAYAASLALDLAEREVRQRLTPQVQQQLVQQFNQNLPEVR